MQFIVVLAIAFFLSTLPATGFTTTDYGTSLEGRHITTEILGQGPKNLLFLAGIHGDEDDGIRTLKQLTRYLQQNPEFLTGRRVIIVADSNPDGRIRQSRFNARGVDLNRNFPSRNWKRSQRSGRRPLSEPESQWLYQLIRHYPPQLIIAMHQFGRQIDYDGPARSVALAMAGVSPLTAKKLGARAGSLGSWAGNDLDIPVITVEMPRSAGYLPDREHWRQYGPMLLQAVIWPKIISPDWQYPLLPTHSY